MELCVIANTHIQQNNRIQLLSVCRSVCLSVCLSLFNQSNDQLKWFTRSVSMFQFNTNATQLTIFFFIRFSFFLRLFCSVDEKNEIFIRFLPIIEKHYFIVNLLFQFKQTTKLISIQSHEHFVLTNHSLFILSMWRPLLD